MNQFDEQYKQYATDRQWEIYEQYYKLGSYTKTGKYFNITESSVRGAISAIKKKAAKNGYNPGTDYNVKIPEGFLVKGVSTLYDKETGEAKIQWVKTQSEPFQQKVRYLILLKKMNMHQQH